VRQLWAPWRLEYVESGANAPGCIFCEKPAADDVESLIVRRGRHAYALMNLFPYANGHLMIAPYRHVREPAELGREERLEIWELWEQAVEALRAAMAPHGFNAGVNSGRVAGAGVEDHIHLHVVPRWNGDTNFMPVLADVRVMPEHVRRSAEKLRAAWPAPETT
jgi:ATP adenylyltransferase